MPVITGRLTDVSRDPMSDASPRLIFEYTSPAVSGISILAARPVEVVPEYNGYFEVELIEDAAISPAGHYSLILEYRDARTRQTRRERLPYELHVPAAGGTLAELLRAPANPVNVWIGPTAPPNPGPGVWWLNSVTGDLSEWSK